MDPSIVLQILQNDAAYKRMTSSPRKFSFRTFDYNEEWQKFANVYHKYYLEFVWICHKPAPCYASKHGNIVLHPYVLFLDVDAPSMDNLKLLRSWNITTYSIHFEFYSAPKISKEHLGILQQVQIAAQEIFFKFHGDLSDFMTSYSELLQIGNVNNITTPFDISYLQMRTLDTILQDRTVVCFWFEISEQNAAKLIDMFKQAPLMHRVEFEIKATTNMFVKDILDAIYSTAWQIDYQLILSLDSPENQQYVREVLSVPQCQMQQYYHTISGTTHSQL